MNRIARLEDELRQLRREVDSLRSVGGITRLRGTLDAGGHRIINLGNPIGGQDALPVSGAGEGGVWSFITVNQHPLLTGSRQLVAGDNITKTDGGAGGTLTLAVDSDDFYAFAFFMR